MRNHDVEMPSRSPLPIYSVGMYNHSLFSPVQPTSDNVVRLQSLSSASEIPDPISDRCAAQKREFRPVLNGTRMKPCLISTSPSSKCVSPCVLANSDRLRLTQERIHPANHFPPPFFTKLVRTFRMLSYSLVSSLKSPHDRYCWLSLH